MTTGTDQWLPSDDPYIAEILRAAPPMSDEQVDDIVAIIMADRS
jgi:hypothetical protein